MDQTQEPNGHVMHYYQQAPLSPTTPPENATSFEAFSKDEVFRKSQKGSGISYAEKVQSYLTDQETVGHPFDGSDQVQTQPFANQAQQKKTDQTRRPSQHGRVQPLFSPEEEADSLQRRAEELPEDPRTQTTHHRDLAITQASLLPAHENEKKLEESVTATRRASIIEPGKHTVSSVSPSVSRTSSMRSKRPQTPQEFLAKIQDFVKNAEMDAEYSQPVWPATPTSSKDLPLAKPVTEAFIAKKQEQQQQQNAPQISIQEPPQASPRASPIPIPVRRNSYTAVKDQDSMMPPEAPPRQRSPKPGYAPKVRDHSPFCVEGPSVFDECLRNPITSPLKNQESEIPKPQLSSRIAPSQGRSYLDKPSTSPDPFGARVELDAPPSANQAAQASSSIMNDLRKEADQRKYDSEMMDDVITLDLRANQEKLEYLSVPSDYSHKTEDLQAAPNRGRSPRKVTPAVIPADRHIPQQLRPDPLTAHETLQHRTSSTFGSGFIPQEDAPTIQETELYKKLSVGLNRLMSTEKFKTLASQTSLDQQALEHQSYSQHLGRAEFGELRKRTTSTTSFQGGGGGGGYVGQQQSRDSSNERPSSAMARMAGSERGRGGHRGNFSSQPNSRDSSFGRHDSRQDDYF